MNEDQIKSLFNLHLAKRGLPGKIKSYSKDVIYNWRQGRVTPSIGDMITVLYELNLVQIHELNRKKTS